MQYNWRPFLELWNAALVIAAKEESGPDIPEAILASGWMGYPSATEEQIVAAETRLGVRLPPSYREFLKVSNGWRTTGSFSNYLWPVEELEFFSKRNQWIIDNQFDDPDHYDPNSSDDPPIAHMVASLELNSEGDATYVLLDPLVTTSDGEWQVHFMASWIPGSYRFDSFWDFMQHECANFLNFDGIAFLQNNPDKATNFTKPDVNVILDTCRRLIDQHGKLSIVAKPVSYRNGIKAAAQEIVNQLQEIAVQALIPNVFAASLLVFAERLSREGEIQDQNPDDYVIGSKYAKRWVAEAIWDLLSKVEPAKYDAASISCAWRPFLERWSAELIEATKWNEWSDDPAEVIESGWMGYPGATEEQIVAAETRLGARLPLSYRDFLKVSNGWRTLGTFIWKMWPVEKLELFSVRNQEWIDILAEYPDALGDDNGAYPTLVHLNASYEITEHGDVAALLDPLNTDEDGEWQTIIMAGWMAGANRYHSFWEMMRHDYQQFLSRLQHMKANFRPKVKDENLLKNIGLLVDKLNDDLPNTRSLQNPPDPMQQIFVNSWYEAAQRALVRVKEIVANNEPLQSAERLQNGLLSWADDLDKEAQAIEQFYQDKPVVDPQSKGQSVAFRRTAHTIREFLGQTT